MKRYAFDHVCNLRDLGGYPAAGGKTTKYKRFLRCDAPIRLSDAELDTLRAMDVTTIIDLRAGQEIEDNPCAMKEQEGFHYHHLPAYLSRDFPELEEDIPKLYFDMIDERNAMRAIMRAIAAAPGGVLYHCSAGKDRTGVVSALLLSLVGVSRGDILADYQVSYTYLRKTIQRMHERVSGLPLFIGFSKIEYMDGFLDLLEENYHSAEEYLLTIGLTDQELSAIKEKLVG